MNDGASIDDVLAARVAEFVDRALAPHLARLAEPLPLVVTTAQAAAMLLVSRATIVRWVDEGRLPILPGSEGRRLIPRAAVERLVAAADTTAG